MDWHYFTQSSSLQNMGKYQLQQNMQKWILTKYINVTCMNEDQEYRKNNVMIQQAITFYPLRKMKKYKRLSTRGFPERSPTSVLTAP